MFQMISRNKVSQIELLAPPNLKLPMSKANRAGLDALLKDG